jgi:hypothetical protein
MTIFEYAVAREWNRLEQESKTRELTEDEQYLRGVLHPTVKLMEQIEQMQDARRNSRSQHSL